MEGSTIETLREWIGGCAPGRMVFFGGAGVSTESGIPDFRSVDGLYNQKFKYPPETIISHSFFERRPEEFFEFYKEKMLPLGFEPNVTHKVLARWEREGKLLAVVTQNIDGLHRMAGNRLVYEIHGSVHENHCMDCGREYDLPWILSTEGIPRCEKCGGIVKPSVVLYGEGLEKYTCMGACREISNCDVLIVAGTSLEVEPAASFIDYFRGRELVVINREETKADERATLVLRGDINEIMGEIRV